MGFLTLLHPLGRGLEGDGCLCPANLLEFKFQLWLFCWQYRSDEVWTVHSIVNLQVRVALKKKKASTLIQDWLPGRDDDTFTTWMSVFVGQTTASLLMWSTAEPCSDMINRHIRFYTTASSADCKMFFVQKSPKFWQHLNTVCVFTA